MSYAFFHNHYELICNHLVLSGPLCFLKSSYMSDSYNLFTLIQKLSEAWKEGCDVQIPFRAELSTVSYSLVVDQLSITMLIATY